MISWSAFADLEPELARFGVARLAKPPGYLATVRRDGRPRVHPVTPIISPRALYLFMEPTSPKGRDLRERRSYALHNGVPDTNGTGGEFFMSGEARFVDDPDTRADAVRASSYEPADRYIVFELLVAEARCNGYGDVTLPERTRWTAPPD
jgi:pyridoxamine 5'-phosphate oxidase-like protein